MAYLLERLAKASLRDRAARRNLKQGRTIRATLHEIVQTSLQETRTSRPIRDPFLRDYSPLNPNHPLRVMLLDGLQRTSYCILIFDFVIEAR